MMASSLAIMPRSPWLASAGWTKKAGVPVEASVAAILAPICAAFADAGDDDPAADRGNQLDRVGESFGQTVVQRFDKARPCPPARWRQSAAPTRWRRFGQALLHRYGMAHGQRITSSGPFCPLWQSRRRSLSQPSINHPCLRFGKHGATLAPSSIGSKCRRYAPTEEHVPAWARCRPFSWLPRLPGWSWPALREPRKPGVSRVP